MKFTIANIINPANKPEDFEYEFGWMYYTVVHKDGKVNHNLQFTELIFFPEFQNFLHSNLPSSEVDKTFISIYRSPNWKPMAKKLKEAIKFANQNYKKPKSIIEASSKEELIEKMKDNRMDDLVGKLDTFPFYSWTTGIS